MLEMENGMNPEVVGEGSDEAEQSGAERLQLLVGVDRPYRLLQRTLAIVSSLTEELTHRNGGASRVIFKTQPETNNIVLSHDSHLWLSRVK